MKNEKATAFHNSGLDLDFNEQKTKTIQIGVSNCYEKE